MLSKDTPLLVRIFQIQTDANNTPVYTPQAILTQFNLPTPLCGIREFIAANSNDQSDVIVRDPMAASRFDDDRFKDDTGHTWAYCHELNLWGYLLLDESLIRLDKNGVEFVYWLMVLWTQVPKDILKATVARYGQMPESAEKKTDKK